MYHSAGKSCTRNIAVEAFRAFRQSSAVLASAAPPALAGRRRSRIPYEALMDALKIASGSLPRIQQVHSVVVINGFSSKSVLRCRLIHLYGQLRRPVDARKVFDGLPRRTTQACNHIMKVFLDEGRLKLVFVLYSEMILDEGSPPNAVTFSIAIRACIGLGSLSNGKMVHAHALVSGIGFDLRLETDVLHFYGKFGCSDMSWALFKSMDQRDSFAWTAMIDGFLCSGAYDRALDLFYGMRDSGSMALLVTWNAMIAGFARGGRISEALHLFKLMQLDGVRPEKVCMCTILSLIARAAVLRPGLESHAFVIRNGMHSELFVLSALVDMYSKCGRLEQAQCVFDRAVLRDTGLWNAIMAGHGIHGNCMEALALFKKMRGSNVRPNDITFALLLSACSHSGMVAEGRWIYELMVSEYGIRLSSEHCSCMVDMYGRAGLFHEALEFLRKLDVEPTREIWGAFLSSCKIHSNLKSIGIATKHLLGRKTDVDNAGYHVILSNIYAENRLWAEVARTRTVMRDERMKKSTGWSWITVGDEIHFFSIADVSHSQSLEIYALLLNLNNAISRKAAI